VLTRRRCLVIAHVVLVVGWVLGPLPRPASPAPRPAAAPAVVEPVTLPVADVDRAANFYARVLFFEKTTERQGWGGDARVRVVQMRLGDETLDLVQDPMGRRPREPVAIVVNDLDQAYLWLQRHRVRVASPAPRLDWNAETGDVRIVRFSDPDGHSLALVQFPAGKGAARWQRPSDRVFLGIDRLPAGNHDAP
jgi:catechol 2,3-dioxygenase-like lactoylglutathione lyase family enzyme